MLLGTPIAVQAVAPPDDKWRHERLWLLLRNIATFGYLGLFLHELLVRVLLYLAVPLLGGPQLPLLPYHDLFLFALLGIGLWRMIADPVWRSRLSLPGLPAIAAFTLLCSAFMWLNLNSLIDLAVIKGVILPLLLYAAGVLSGVDRKLFLRFFLIAAFINLAVTIGIVLFWWQPYSELIFLLDLLMPRAENFFSAVFRHATVNVPTGLALARLAYMTIFSIAGLLSLREYAHSTLKLHKLLYFLSFLVSTAAVLSTFSRSGVATYTLAVLFYLAAAGLAERRGMQTQTSGVRLLGVAFALCLCGFLLINHLLNQANSQVNFLAGDSLTSSSGGRFGMWSGILAEVDRKQGWLFGTRSDFRLYYASVVKGSKEVVWSENAYLTVDNQYLNILLKGGLAAVFCYFMACVLITAQFWRNQDWTAFGFMLFTLLIDLNLRSGSYGQDVICLIGGSLVADAAMKQYKQRWPSPRLARGPVVQAELDRPHGAAAEQLG